MGHVRLASLKFITSCYEVKILEVVAISFDLESISSLNLLNIQVESNCLEVVNLLNNKTVDLSEVSFFVDEAKAWGRDMRIVSWHTWWRKQLWRSMSIFLFFFFFSFENKTRIN